MQSLFGASKRGLDLNLVDVAIGFSAIVAVFILSLLTGSFSFFAPWIFWAGVLLFVAGYSRVLPQEEAVWRRVVSINLCWLILVPVALRGVWWMVFLTTAGTFVPTAAGLLARRLIARSRFKS